VERPGTSATGAENLRAGLEAHFHTSDGPALRPIQNLWESAQEEDDIETRVQPGLAAGGTVRYITKERGITGRGAIMSLVEVDATNKA
jgi:hypothetical protein